MRNHNDNIKYRQAIILGFALLFLLFAGHAFAENCTDYDNDGFGDIITNSSPCIDQLQNCTCGDCNDSDDTMYPGAPMLCDRKDNNCDGV
ncbi:MAG: putative metal-binding motif-containing protein, partial [archaeon]|nr:putative metal-binding motif-containing protein [archaeon]